MLTDILSLLLEACAGFFGYLLLLRFLLQWRRVSFANPLAELTMRTTNWVVLPLRRVLPGLLGLDLASLIPAWLLQVLAKYIQLLFKTASLGAAPFLAVPALVLGVFEVLHMGVMILVVAMLLQAVLSWVNPYSPLSAPVAAVMGLFGLGLAWPFPPAITAVALAGLVVLSLMVRRRNLSRSGVEAGPA